MLNPLCSNSYILSCYCTSNKIGKKYNHACIEVCFRGTMNMILIMNLL